MTLQRENLMRIFGLSVLLACLPACGGEEGNGPDATQWDPVAEVVDILTVQQSITLAEFETARKDDADLDTVATGLTLSHAGRVEDSRQSQVTWAEGTTLSGGVAGAVYLCDAQGCQVGLQGRASGKITWQDAAGAQQTMRPVGQPVLLKDLQGHDLSNQTILALSTGPLGIKLDQDDIPAIDFSKRRFVALNTFGDLLSTNLDEILQVAEDRGNFTVLEEIQYAREETVGDVLDSMDYLDVVVWLSQGVREERKSGGQEYVTVGLTANRAGYGETLFHRQDIADMWHRNVALGPGIFVMAASNSYSDGTPNQPEAGGSLWMKLNETDRVLVGIEGHADVNSTIRAVAVFLHHFLGGEATLGESLDLGSDWIREQGAVLRTNQKDLLMKVVKTNEAISASLPFEPSNIRLSMPVTGTPRCGEGDGPKTPKDEDFATAWADITLTGSFFEGDRVVNTQNLKVDTHIRGMITGFEEGDRVFVETWGDMDKVQFQSFYAFGEAVISKKEIDEDGKITLFFGGNAHTGEYLDEKGYNCVLVGPSVATTTGSLGTLVLTP
jgi:hypothetical protein